ncbi:GGDEF domain-containing protein [Baekduia soli]|uniref:GGDEF domain-containing protein n=1 Tax=Baekduia soli TaxID=496014 RepID=A0A5B8U9W6_9ACTN|nr:GGDEF domain-containing protein [Baekduia soli]QEC49973.1 GGDEF domain-containing protein [Baekduia soli]
MSLRHPFFGAATRVLLSVAGLVAGTVYGAWPTATACFAGLAALTIARARAAERHAVRQRELSLADPLTGVGNYRRLHERLHEVTAQDPERFALLTLDVDSFKAINETHGHLEGDRLLQEVGRVLVENVRGSDVVARQGGDEFAVLVPEADADGATLLVQRIEAALARIDAADHTPVRASIGVAVFPQDGATPDDLLEKADLHLRLTKQRRRAAALLSDQPV